MSDKNIKLKSLDGQNVLYPKTKVENIIDFPSTGTAGKVLKSTSTPNVLEWGDGGSYTAGTGIDITNNTIKATGVEYKNNETTQANPLKFVQMTQAQYDALATKDANTFYIIVG